MKSAYDSIQDLYNFDEVEEIELSPVKTSHMIDNESYKGYMVQHEDKQFFIHRLQQSDGSNRTMGNLWIVYSIHDNKTFISGTRTKKQALKDIQLKLIGSVSNEWKRIMQIHKREYI